MEKLSKRKQRSLDQRGYYWDIPEAICIKKLSNTGKIRYTKIYGPSTAIRKSKNIRSKKG